MNNKVILTLAIVAIVVGGGVVYTQTNMAASNAADTVAEEAASTTNTVITEVPPADEVESVTLEAKVDHPALNDAPLEKDFVMGEATAPITLIEYASLSCPHCADFHNEVLPKLKEAYISKGKLRYILRQFPLNEPAMAGAMLVTCMGDQGGQEQYYKYNEVLFGAQNKWAFDADFKKSLLTFAQVGGTTPEEFDACLKNDERETYLLSTRQTAGESLGVTGTPYIFLNGHPHGGNKSFNAVKKEIEALLPTQE